MEKIFKTSLNTASWLISIFIIGFTIGITMMLINYLEERDSHNWLIWAFPGFMALVCLGLFLYRPVHYLFTPYSFVVHRLVNDVVVDLNQLELVRTVSKEEMGLPIRTFGNGGLFGYTGSYFSDRLGNMTWYATRTDKYVLVQLKGGKKWILTPDEPAEFVTYWQSVGIHNQPRNG
jgi:Bacterial PH domain